MRPLEKLKKSVDRVIVPDLFDVESMDSLLESRDSSRFDSDWVAADQRLQECLLQGDLRGEDSKAIDSIREIAYKRTFEVTGDPDTSGYVSDDFGLVALALALGRDDEWVNALWRCYRSGDFPHGEIEGVTGRLSDLVE